MIGATMTDSKILTPEEMTEILNITQDNHLDLTQLIGKNLLPSRHVSKHYSSRSLINITSLTIARCQEVFTRFYRKQVEINFKKAEVATLEELIKDKQTNYIYFIAKISPKNFPTLVIIDQTFLYQSIDLLFGGKVNDIDVVPEKIGKVSLLLAEKICALFLDAFLMGCKEQFLVSYEFVKIVTQPNLITKIQETDRFYQIENEITIGSKQSTMCLLVDENFFGEYIPESDIDAANIASAEESWKTAIQSQVIDSVVTLSIALPNITIHLKEFLSMEKDSIIEIPDPTAVFIELNNTKIYKGVAGQRNDRRVIEIEREI
jgi:flagellar motor switch protein FliM